MHRPFLNNTKRDHYKFTGYLTGEEIKNRNFNEGEVVYVRVPEVEKVVDGVVQKDDNGNVIMEPGVLELDGLTLKDKDSIIYCNGWNKLSEYKPPITNLDKLEGILHTIARQIEFSKASYSLNPYLHEEKESSWRHLQKEFNEIMDDLCSEISKRK